MCSEVQKCLKRRDGTSGINGQLYEIELLMLFLLNGLKKIANGQLLSFFLETNLADAGDFDDVVFSYTYRNKNNEIKSGLIFLQAKHRDNLEKENISIEKLMSGSDKADFSLLKYFRIHRQIKKKFREINHPMFNGAFEDSKCEFIIFTNAGGLVGSQDTSIQHFPINCTKFDHSKNKGNLNKMQNNITQFDPNDNTFFNLFTESKDLFDNSLSTYTKGDQNNIDENNINQFDSVDDSIFNLFDESENIILDQSLPVSKTDQNSTFKLETVDHKTNSGFNRKLDNVIEFELDGDNIMNLFGGSQDVSRHYYQISYQKTDKSKIKFMENASDCKTLAKELATAVVSGKIIDINKPIFKSYRIALAKYVIIQIKPQEGRFRDTFFKSASTFLTTFTDTVSKITNKNENQWKSELVGKKIILPDNFSMDLESDENDLLPDDLVENDEIEEFFNQVKIFIDQPSERELGQLIKKEIQNNCSVQQDEENLIFCDVQNKIQKWWKEGTGPLTEANTLYEDAKQNLSQLTLVGLSTLRSCQIENFEVKFKNDQIEQLNNAIKSHQILNIVTDKSTTLLSSIKIFQALESMDEYKSDNDYKYIFMNMSSILALQKKVIGNFQFKNNLLVIECEDECQNIESLYEELSKVLEKRSKKIILISKSNNKLAYLFGTNNTRNYSQFEDKIISLIDLESESQKNLLEQADVFFQGTKVKLNTLINENNCELKKYVRSDVLNQILVGEKLEICNKLQDLGEIRDFYINRKFNRQIYIGSNCFIELADLFAISGTNREALSRLIPQNESIRLFTEGDLNSKKPIRFILIDSKYAEQNFFQLCKEYANYSIHWLDGENHDWKWKQTHGQIKKLRKHLKPKINQNTLTKLSDPTGKVVVISAEAGMGKSTVLTWLAEQTKDFDAGLWTTRINLVDHAKKLEILAKNDIQLNKQVITEFLSVSANLKTELEREIFKDLLLKQGKVVLIFDGYDEVNLNVKNKVIELLQNVLNETRVEKIWVSTRLNMRNELENEFSTFSYTLEPFSRKDQKNFLEKYWCRTLRYDYLDSNRSSVFIDELLNKFAVSINDQERKFMGIPLQLRMIAEVFENLFKLFYESLNSVLSEEQKQKINEELSLSKLYKRFVKKKYFKILCEEKGKIDVQNPYNKPLIKEGYKKFIRDHKKLALYTIFHQDYLNELLSNDEMKDLHNLLDNIKEGKEKSGLIDRLIDTKPIFVHQTFAEYFVALTLVDMLENEQNYKIIGNFLHKISIRSSNYKIIQHFFDRIAAQDKKRDKKYIIHTATLNNDVNRIHELLRDLNTTEIASLLNSRDKAGRTPLHLAASYGYVDSVTVLLNYNAEINVTDKIFEWKPLAYADGGRYWHVADLLLKQGANDEDMIQAHSLINSYNAVERKETLLHKAAQEGLTYFAKFLIKSGASINTPSRNHYNKTPFHLAAKFGHLNVMKLFVEEKGNIKCIDDDHYTVLHDAALHGHVDVVKYILDKKELSVNVKDKYDRTPLYMAAENGHTDIVRLLLDNGAMLNIQSSVSYDSLSTRKASGWTALHIAAFKGHIDIVQLLVNRGAKTDVKDSINRTALDLAVNDGYIEVVKFLNPDDKVCLLHMAVQRDDLIAVNDLINNGVDINKKMGDFTPLHLAAFGGFFEMTKILVENGANISDPGVDGFTPLHAAASNGHLNVVKYLVSQGAKVDNITSGGWTSLHGAAQNGRLNVVKYFLLEYSNEEQRIDIDIKDNKGTTPLHTAAFHKQPDIVEFLIEQQADINAIDILGATVLFYSAINCNNEITKLLLKQPNIKIDAIDVDSEEKTLLSKLRLSVLHVAAAYDDLEIVDILVKKRGVNINIGETTSVTPLHCAAFFDSCQVIEYLIEHNANANASIKLSFIVNVLRDIKDGDTLKSSGIHGVINQLYEFVKYFKSFAKLTPKIKPITLHKALNYPRNHLLKAKSRRNVIRDYVRVGAIKSILSIDFVSEQVHNFIAYSMQRKNTDLDRPLDAGFLLYAEDSFDVESADDFSGSNSTRSSKKRSRFKEL